MKQEQFLSVVREVVTAVSAAVASYGLLNDNLLAASGGLVTALAMVVWSIVTHAGKGVVGTLLRKLVSAGAGFAVAFGAVTPERAEALAGVALVAISIYFGNKKAATNLILLGLSATFLMGLSSCTGIRATDDGCLLGKVEGPEGTYWAGPCFKPGEDGKSNVDRYQVIWESEGNTFRATYFTHAKTDLKIDYKVNGVWASWDEDTGILLGAVPVEVQKAQAGKPVAIPDPSLPPLEELPEVVPSK